MLKKFSESVCLNSRYLKKNVEPAFPVMVSKGRSTIIALNKQLEEQKKEKGGREEKDRENRTWKVKALGLIAFRKVLCRGNNSALL